MNDSFRALCEAATARPYQIRLGDPARENLVANVRGIPIYGPRKSVACQVDAAFLALAANNIEALVEMLTESRLYASRVVGNRQWCKSREALLAKIEAEASR